MQSTIADTLSKRGFGELIGVSPGRVSQMISDGLPVEPNGRIDIAKGKAWVSANVDQNRRRARVDGTLFDSSKREREAAEARIASIKAERLADRVIDRDETLRTIETRARFERDAWIGWVNRVAPEIARLANADVAIVVSVLDRMVREQLATLAATPLGLPVADQAADLPLDRKPTNLPNFCAAASEGQPSANLPKVASNQVADLRFENPPIGGPSEPGQP